MGFNPASLDTRKQSDEGVWFTLEDLDGNEIFEDGEPVQVCLYGRDSAIAKQALEDHDGDIVELTSRLIKEWSDNLEAKSAEEIAGVPHLADFISAKVLNRANFTIKPSKS